MRVDGRDGTLVREPDGTVRWFGGPGERHVPGRRFFSPAQVWVQLDGREIGPFVAADDVEGWVEVYRLGAGTEPIRERLEGRVEFVWPEVKP